MKTLLVVILLILYRACSSSSKSLKFSGSAPAFVLPCRRGVTFFPTSLTTLRVIKTSFLNTFGRLYLLREQVAMVGKADVLHQAPDAPPLKDANSRLPHVVNLGGKHLSESVVAVQILGLFVGLLGPL